MNKKMNKKGFTIVELVIVIAVIAILAAVMIPTFGGIIDTANKSAVSQTATAAYKEAYGLALADGQIPAAGESYTINVDGGSYTFKFTGTLSAVQCQITADNVNDDYTVSYNNGIVVTKK